MPCPPRASWAGLAIGEVIRCLGVPRDRCWFWATHGRAELDLLVTRGARRLGFEIRRPAAPKVTPSMRSARNDLELDEIIVVHSGRESFPMAPGIRAVPLGRISEDVA